MRRREHPVPGSSCGHGTRGRALSAGDARSVLGRDRWHVRHDTELRHDRDRRYTAGLGEQRYDVDQAGALPAHGCGAEPHDSRRKYLQVRAPSSDVLRGFAHQHHHCRHGQHERSVQFRRARGNEPQAQRATVQGHGDEQARTLRALPVDAGRSSSGTRRVHRLQRSRGRDLLSEHAGWPMRRHTSSELAMQGRARHARCRECRRPVPPNSWDIVQRQRPRRYRRRAQEILVEPTVCVPGPLPAEARRHAELRAEHRAQDRDELRLEPGHLRRTGRNLSGPRPRAPHGHAQAADWPRPTVASPLRPGLHGGLRQSSGNHRARPTRRV